MLTHFFIIIIYKYLTRIYTVEYIFDKRLWTIFGQTFVGSNDIRLDPRQLCRDRN